MLKLINLSILDHLDETKDLAARMIKPASKHFEERARRAR